MCIKMIYNVTTFKNAFQNQTAKFNNAKPQLLLHQTNKISHEFEETQDIVEDRRAWHPTVHGGLKELDVT